MQDDIGLVMAKGLSVVYKQKPENPVDFFAKWLLLQAEIKKKEDEKRQKEEAIKKAEEDQKKKIADELKKKEDEQKKKENPKAQLEQQPPKEDGPTMTSIVVNHILNEDDKDDEADIQKVVHRVNTDEERLQKALK